MAQHKTAELIIGLVLLFGGVSAWLTDSAIFSFASCANSNCTSGSTGASQLLDMIFAGAGIFLILHSRGKKIAI